MFRKATMRKLSTALLIAAVVLAVGFVLALHAGSGVATVATLAGIYLAVSGYSDLSGKRKRRRPRSPMSRKGDRR